ncbi:MAG: hypothetical protein ACRD3A_01700 [Terriglobales bacterium]
MIMLKTVVFYVLLLGGVSLAGIVAACWLLVFAGWLEARGERSGHHPVSEFGMVALMGMFLLMIDMFILIWLAADLHPHPNKWLLLAFFLAGLSGLFGFIFRDVLRGRKAESRPPMPRYSAPSRLPLVPAVRDVTVKIPGPPPVPTQPHVCAARVIEHPVCGRVVEVALVGSDCEGLPSRARRLLDEEVAQHWPEHLIVNLLGFDSAVDNTLLGALVSGRTAMYSAGAKGETRILATGRTAAELERILPIMKLYSFFGGKTYSNLEAALEHMAAQSAPR